MYQVPVGPVHAGIIEPGHFRFSVIGEKIFNLEIRMFYKHRGIEKLAEGKTPVEVIPIAEAVSSDESVANATAYCCAIEKITGTVVPDRAWYIRTILLELERIHSHLGDQGGMLVDVGFPLGASQFAVLREDIFRMNATLTGSRFLRGMIIIGGLSHDIGNDQMDALKPFLLELKKRYRVGLKIVLSTTSILDRFSPTGVIKNPSCARSTLPGRLPVHRVAGEMCGATTRTGYMKRTVLPYEPFMTGMSLPALPLRPPRSWIPLISLNACLTAGRHGVHSPVIRDGYALSLVESARGQDLCWVWIRNGVVDRYKVRTASFCNWLAIEHAVQGEIPLDFPVINKSLNLSYAGTDL